MDRFVANDRPGGVPRRWLLTALAACSASAVLLASTPGARAQGAGVDAAARAMLPEVLQKSRVLHVGLEINYAPWMYQAGSQAEGIDPSLIRAIAAKLGLTPTFAFVEFPAILPGVQSGRFDVGANFANTAARRKVVSFVNYLGFVDGSLIQKGNPRKVNVKDMCGLRVSAGVGSFQYSNLSAMSEQCVKNGKPQITIVPMATTDGINALRAGRVDAEEIGMVANTYAASQPGGQDLEAVTPPTVVSAPTLGYITSNDADGKALAQAMAAALNAMNVGANFADTAARRKVVSFVNYLRFADGLLILKGNPRKVDVKDMCGLRIAAGVGSFQYSNATKMGELCVKTGKPPIKVVPLSPTDAINALRTDRVDAEEDDAIATFYTAGQPGNQDLEALVLPIVVAAGALGYITNKDADGAAVAHAMAAALNAMIKNDEYATILRKWNVPQELWLKKAFVD